MMKWMASQVSQAGGPPKAKLEHEVALIQGDLSALLVRVLVAAQQLLLFATLGVHVADSAGRVYNEN